MFALLSYLSRLVELVLGFPNPSADWNSIALRERYWSPSEGYFWSHQISLAHPRTLWHSLLHLLNVCTVLDMALDLSLWGQVEQLAQWNYFLIRSLSALTRCGLVKLLMSGWLSYLSAVGLKAMVPAVYPTVELSYWVTDWSRAESEVTERPHWVDFDWVELHSFIGSRIKVRSARTFGQIGTRVRRIDSLARLLSDQTRCYWFLDQPPCKRLEHTTWYESCSMGRLLVSV